MALEGLHRRRDSDTLEDIAKWEYPKKCQQVSIHLYVEGM